jgi:hypothetical protein
VIHLSKVSNVFQKKSFWLLRMQDAEDFTKQLPLYRRKTLQRPGLAEGLAREPCRQHIVIWHEVGRDLGDVAARQVAKVARVHCPGWR